MTNNKIFQTNRYKEIEETIKGFINSQADFFLLERFRVYGLLVTRCRSC